MRRCFPKFLIRPPPSTHEEKVIHWNLCRTWHELSVHYNKKGGIEMEKLCQTCGISLNLGSSPCPTPVRRNIESFFCSNIYILCLLTCLLASLPDEGEEFFKINFSVPISVYLAKQPSHLHMCTKNCNKIQSKMNNLDQCPTQFDQRYKVLICASIFWFQAVISQWVSESYFLDALASFDFKLRYESSTCSYTL